MRPVNFVLNRQLTRSQGRLLLPLGHVRQHHLAQSMTLEQALMRILEWQEVSFADAALHGRPRFWLRISYAARPRRSTDDDLDCLKWKCNSSRIVKAASW